MKIVSNKLLYVLMFFVLLLVAFSSEETEKRAPNMTEIRVKK